MECSVTCLTCGYNGTGNAALVTVERIGHNANRIIQSRCLINIGDGTQKFCNENQIKISTISTIIITSLAPHNISGLPGIFLTLSDLGAGNLTIIGPNGIKSYLDVMIPFMNRKYPALNIIEISQYDENLIINLNSFIFNIQPIYADINTFQVIALAVRIQVIPNYNRSESKSLVLTDAIVWNLTISVYPMAHYFQTYPSLEQYLSKFCVVVDSIHVILLASLAVSSNIYKLECSSTLEYPDSIINNIHNSTNSDTIFKIHQLCMKYVLQGILFPGVLGNNYIEFNHAHYMLSMLSHICPVLFPYKLSSTTPAAISLPPSHPHSSNTLCRPTLSWEVMNSSLSSPHLIIAKPLLSIFVSIENIESSSQPYGNPAILKHHTAFSNSNYISAKINRSTEIYQKNIFPNLAALLEQKLNEQKNNKTENGLVIDATESIETSFKKPFIPLPNLNRFSSGESTKILNKNKVIIPLLALSELKSDNREEEIGLINTNRSTNSIDTTNNLLNLTQELGLGVNEFKRAQLHATAKATVAKAVSFAVASYSKSDHSSITTSDSNVIDSPTLNFTAASLFRMSFQQKRKLTNSSSKQVNDFINDDVIISQKVIKTIDDEGLEVCFSSRSDRDNSDSKDSNLNSVTANLSQDSPSKDLKAMHLNENNILDFHSSRLIGKELTISTDIMDIENIDNFSPNSMIDSTISSPLSSYSAPNSNPNRGGYKPNGFKSSVHPIHIEEVSITDTELPVPLVLSSTCLSLYAPAPDPFLDICSITFLGTGSATPSKYRNSSCIILNLYQKNQHHIKKSIATKYNRNPFTNEETFPSNKIIADNVLNSNNSKLNESSEVMYGSILLDVGENTSSQLYRSVSGDIQKYDNILLGIKVIWISHHHADHITGFPMLLEQIQLAKIRQLNHIKRNHLDIDDKNNKLLTIPITKSKYEMKSMYMKSSYEENKILVIGSEAVLKFFEFATCVSGLDSLITFYPILNTLYAGITKDISLATGGIITRLRSIPVHHCHSSYGLVLDFETSHKIVYSGKELHIYIYLLGDCRPSQSLVNAGLNCDLLIHEATFDDTKQEDAIKKRHSTISEARSIAKRIHAKHTILTHFSQRYPLEVLNNQSCNQDVNIINHNKKNNILQAQLQRYINYNSIYSINCNTLSDNSEKLQSNKIENIYELQEYSSVYAFDFLKFSFPSQIITLSKVTFAIGIILTKLDQETKLDDYNSY